MKRLEQLPEMANQGLGGLTAGQDLKFRIQKAALAQEQAQHSPRRWLTPALCGAAALTVAVTVGVTVLRPSPSDVPETLISTRAAGVTQRAPHIRALLDLQDNSVSVGQSAEVPAYRSLWSSGDNGNFPLIGVNGRFYRLLKTPDSVSDSLLGSSLGDIQEFTTEPSLSGTDVILSNKASQGTTVYEVSGMGGTLVCASVDGVNRAFQRVGYNSSALKGSESLADTLQITGHVTRLELSDVGIVTDISVCDSLISTLMDNASYESSGSVNGKQSLVISLDNGLTVQMAVKNDSLSACGTWSCPEFIEAFADAVN